MSPPLTFRIPPQSTVYESPQTKKLRETSNEEMHENLIYLPEDFFQDLFIRFLNPFEVVRFSQTCSTFYQYLKDENILETIILNHFPKLSFLKDNHFDVYQQFQIIFNNYLPAYKYNNELNVLSNKIEHAKLQTSKIQLNKLHAMFPKIKCLKQNADITWNEYVREAERNNEQCISRNIKQFLEGDYDLPTSNKALEVFLAYIMFEAKLVKLVGDHFDGSLESLDQDSKVIKKIRAEQISLSEPKNAAKLAKLKKQSRDLRLKLNSYSKDFYNQQKFEKYLEDLRITKTNQSHYRVTYPSPIIQKKVI